MRNVPAADPVFTVPAAPGPPPEIGYVAALTLPGESSGNVHDRASRRTLLTRTAELLGLAIRGEDGILQAEDTLFIPADAVEQSAAHQAGIARAEQIFGGVVPAAFVATKAITHGLLHPRAVQPPMWEVAMKEVMGDAALNGYTAFSRADAVAAGRLLLANGPVRIKDVCAKAGLGQTVVHNEAELGNVLAQENDADLAQCGIVLEENLTDVVTYSVGTVELGGSSISYWGSQNLTTDHHGREVYGGSDLYAVRGSLHDLVAEPLPPAIARAVACADTFDRAARLAYPAMILTRRNYDVIEGTDAAGRRRIGVLEQSWRVGGASGAEIAAFEAFRDEPGTKAVRCSTVEVYEEVDPPIGATVYFHGVDPVVGAMTKYAVRLA